MSNTFAFKEVLDFTAFTYAASGYGNVLFSVDYAKSANVSTTAERLPIRGGSGNYKILDLDHTRDCTFGSTLPIIDINVLATKLGKASTIGAKAAPNKVILTVSAGNTVVLPHTPIANTLKIHKLALERDLGVEQVVGTPASVPNSYSLATATVTFHAASCAVGSKVICFYEYMSGVTAQNIKITASDFPAFITITGRALVDDDQEGKKIPVSFKIHKAKVQTNFELTMASDAATEIDFTTDCYTIINSAGVREYVDIVKLNDEAV